MKSQVEKDKVKREEVNKR